MASTTISIILALLFPAAMPFHAATLLLRTLLLNPTAAQTEILGTDPASAPRNLLGWAEGVFTVSPPPPSACKRSAKGKPPPWPTMPLPSAAP